MPISGQPVNSADKGRGLAGVRAMYWFYFQPRGWLDLMRLAAPDLPPYATLLHLVALKRLPRRLQRLLLNGYLGYPVALGLLIGLLIPGDHRSAAGIVLGIVLGILVGLALGLVVSIAAGLATAIVGAGIFTILLGSIRLITIDLLLGHWLGAALGLCAASAVSVLINPQPVGREFDRLRQAGSIILGMIVSAGVLAVVTGVTLFVVSNWQQGRIDGGTTAVLLIAAPLTVFVLAAGISSGSWRLGLGGGLVISAGIGSLIVAFLGGVTYDGDLVGATLRDITMVLVTTAFLMLFLLPYALANWLGGVWAGRIAGSAGSLAVHSAFYGVYPWYMLWPNLLLHGTLIGLGLTIHLWRPLLFYPFELVWSELLARLEKQRAMAAGSLLYQQPVFWDAYQYMPLVGLLDHLLLVAERKPDELEPMLTAVSQSRQHHIARLALIELEARRLESLPDVVAIAGVQAQLSATLPTDALGALLRSLRHISLDVAAALGQHSSYNRRLALSATADRLNGLVRELTRSRESYALRFRPVAVHWFRLVSQHAEALQTAVARRQEIEDPYVIGVPLTAQQEIFVGRRDVSQRIEQLLLYRRGPPLLLYGQRRMGKTSLLNNLGRLLPQHVTPLFVDLQGPVSFASDHAGLFYNLARGMQRSAYDQRNIQLPPFTRTSATADPFTAFDVWLDQVEQQLITKANTCILLMLDEFEALHEALQMERFRESFVLGTLRHLIQHRHHFKVLLAGSHTLDEFKRWSGYLINAEVIHLGCLHEEEAKQLIERPLPDFNLAYLPEVSRHVFSLTNGHPFLLQLLCSEIIGLKNIQPIEHRWVVRLEDVETAVPHALARGSMFFLDLEQNQSDSLGTTILHCLANEGEGAVWSIDQMIGAGLPPHDLPAALERLRRRVLLAKTDEGYRFQIEMVRRWFVR
jgi:hypothetical protein